MQTIGDLSHSQQAERADLRKSQLLHKIRSAHLILCTNAVGKQTCKLVPHPQIQAPTWLTAFESGSGSSQSKESNRDHKVVVDPDFTGFRVLKAIHSDSSESPLQFSAAQEKRKWFTNACNCTIRCILARISLTTTVVTLILQKKTEKKQTDWDEINDRLLKSCKECEYDVFPLRMCAYLCGECVWHTVSLPCCWNRKDVFSWELLCATTFARGNGLCVFFSLVKLFTSKTSSHSFCKWIITIFMLFHLFRVVFILVWGFNMETTFIWIYTRNLLIKYLIN